MARKSLTKKQAIKFWRALDDSTEAKAVIDRYKNKTGWPSAATLERCATAHKLFKEGAGVEEVVQKARWSLRIVTRIYAWWMDQFGAVSAESNESEAETSERELRQGEEYKTTLRRLVSELRAQLKVPAPDRRIRERRSSKHEFLLDLSAEPGSHWYWGWEADRPILAAEMDMDYQALHDQAMSWPFWRDLDSLRTKIGEYVRRREEVVMSIESEAETLTRLPVMDSGRAERGSLTRSFAATVYIEAVRQKTTGYRELPGRYRIDESFEVSGPARGIMQFRSQNHAMLFDGILVAWVTRSTDLFSLHDPRQGIAQDHAQLVLGWSRHERVAEIIEQYRRLDSTARTLQRQLAPTSLPNPLREPT